MELKYPLIDIGELDPVDCPFGNKFRVAISQTEGSSSLAYHIEINPGEKTLCHSHDRSAEILVFLSGRGISNVGGINYEVRSGHCMHIPTSTPHFFHNTSEEIVEIVGFFIGSGAITEPELRINDGAEPMTLSDPPIVHWDDVIPENMNKEEGWHINDFRLPFGEHNGSNTTLFRAQFFPGAVHKKHSHKNCDEIYYLISGHGLAGAGPDRVEITGGNFHYIPAGVEHWLQNLSKTDPIHVIGVYIGAGSVAKTGYIYHGEVTPEDLAANRNR